MIKDDLNLIFFQKTTASEKMSLGRNLLEESKNFLDQNKSNESLDQVTRFQVANVSHSKINVKMLVVEGKGQATPVIILFWMNICGTAYKLERQRGWGVESTTPFRLNLHKGNMDKTLFAKGNLQDSFIQAHTINKTQLLSS